MHGKIRGLQERADTRSYRPADGEERVEAGHDRLAPTALDDDGLLVHRDIHHATAQAQHEQRHAQLPGTGCEPGQRDADGEDHTGHGGDAAATHTVDVGPDDLHAHHRARTEQQQQATEGAVEMPNCCWTAGMLTTHIASASPARKNSPTTARRGGAPPVKLALVTHEPGSRC